MSLQIHPLCLGRSIVDKAGLVLGLVPGTPAEICDLMWVITGGREAIVVDTGPADPDFSARYHRVIHEWRSAVPAVASLDIDPEKVKTVINTHLHWDHCYGNSLFKNASIYVQREELRYALNPLPKDRRYYEADLGTLPFMAAHSSLVTIEGELEIASGVTLVPIPGHTPGMQGVAVETRNGIYFIASDAVGLFENWEQEPPITGRIYVDLDQFHQSLAKIRGLADFVLPGHDPRVLDRKEYP